ncbi:hypothetical protein Tco_1465866 [Tanacetum coccineum]
MSRNAFYMDRYPESVYTCTNLLVYGIRCIRSCLPFSSDLLYWALKRPLGHGVQRFGLFLLLIGYKQISFSYMQSSLNDWGSLSVSLCMTPRASSSALKVDIYGSDLAGCLISRQIKLCFVFFLAIIFFLVMNAPNYSISISAEAGVSGVLPMRLL